MKPYYETPLGKLYHADCLQIMPELEPVDLVLTDPPYGLTACKWDLVIPLDEMWVKLKTIIKKNTAIVLFGSEPYSSVLRMSNIKKYKYDWVWCKNIKTGSTLSKKRPLKQHENVSVFYNKQCVYNPIMVKRTESELKKLSKNSLCKSELTNVIGDLNNKNQKRENMGFKYPTSQLKINGVFNRSIEKVNHPTQKPVSIMEYLIKTYTNEGGAVLDFCIGSGTTAIACERLKRRWIGIEIEEKYCEVAAKRIKQERKQLNLF